MRLLLNDCLAPITSEIGLIETDHHSAAREFLEWQRTIHEGRGLSLVNRSVSGTVEEVLLTLLPLTSIEARRYLFVPTASPWTAYFDNGWRGTDAVSAMSYLAGRISCRGLRVVAIPDAVSGTGNIG